MIRVLVDGYIFQHYPHGGIARFFREIMLRIAAGNGNIHFHVLADEKALPNLPVHPQIHPECFHRLGWRPSRAFSHVNAWRRGYFDRSIEALRPQIFHSTYYTLPPFGGMKTVATVYDLIDYQFPLLQPNGEGFVDRQAGVLARADRIISISQATAEKAVFAFGLDRAKLQTVHLGASTTFFPSTEEEGLAFKSKYTKGNSFYLFVGETSGYKNLGTLFRAFARVAAQTQHFLVIAGHSAKTIDSWQIDLAIQLGVEERIVRIHHPDDGLLRVAYGASSAFVFPTLQEGFGIPLLEAMQCDTAVVASDIPVFHEVCGDAALYFEPHNPEELAERLLRVSLPVASNTLRERGRLRAKGFSWEKAATAVEKVYLEMVC